MLPADTPIVITGAAGLIGQNLAVRLAARGHTRVIGIDKHPTNTAVLRHLHPTVTVIEADLAAPGAWESAFPSGAVVIQAHAQIGGTDATAFEANNIAATRRVLAAAAGARHLVHISSSVVNSAARDLYAETKRAQEELVRVSGIPHVVLRPTLMFGWFDRKHLGWLARFMRRVPLFPVPGDGRYRRQPLYAGDFCDIVLACVAAGRIGGPHDISGLETIDYIDLMRAVRAAAGARATIVPLPVAVFGALLDTYAMFDRNPPFTRRQMQALRLPELFPVIDWPGLFGVRPTPLATALERTFREKPWCDVELAF